MGYPQTVADIFPKEWLSPEDLAGRTVTLEIASVEFREIFIPQTKQKVTKPVISFKGAKKKLLANKTQTYAIAEVLQTGTFASWPGGKIALSSARTASGKDTIAIHRPAGNGPQRPPAMEEMEDADED